LVEKSGNQDADSRDSKQTIFNFFHYSSFNQL
jgi:hypothetical protein